MADTELTLSIERLQADSLGTYGAKRVHAELHLGLGLACGRKRVARLVQRGLAGVCHRHKRGQNENHDCGGSVRITLEDELGSRRVIDGATGQDLRVQAPG